MAFPEDVLTADEYVVLHLHPHWKQLVRPVFATVASLAAVVAGFIWLPHNTVGTVVLYGIAALALIFVLCYGIWPFLVWRTTHYVFTNERVLLQRGVLSRDRRDIPLGRVNDHSMQQRFIERLLGCGTLTIESAGERGQSVLTDIPHVQRVQTTLYELIEAYVDKHTLSDREMRDIIREAQEGAQP
ncbi:MAG: hypothetical protein DIU79_09580 [Actinobacteria bacterium]|nr:MAG: hypothetical protein DIU79_09580 [Actinomycetota bacterium]